ncbi:MAG: hypothetical protein K0S47_2804 [Herbinix sp.]|jgi:hypothetical protein|nr:hypothetical protein [Herbinix sp.]
MYRAKLCGFAIACMVGYLGVNPVTAVAAETNTESVTLSDKGKQDEIKSDFYDKMNKALEKWNTLSAKQKEEVYVILETEMKAELKLMDKLVSLGVMPKEDVENYKTNLVEKFTQMRESGDFPFFRQKGHKSRK